MALANKVSRQTFNKPTIIIKNIIIQVIEV